MTRKLVRVQSTSDSTEKTTWRALDWSRWRKEKKKEKIIKRQEKKGKEKRTEKEHGELEATKDAGGVVVTLEDRKHGKFVTVNAEPPNRLVDTTREANEKTTGAGYFFCPPVWLMVFVLCGDDHLPSASSWWFGLDRADLEGVGTKETKRKKIGAAHVLHELTDDTVPLAGRGIAGAVDAVRTQLDDVVETGQTSDLLDQVDAEAVETVVGRVVLTVAHHDVRPLLMGRVPFALVSFGCFFFTFARPSSQPRPSSSVMPCGYVLFALFLILGRCSPRSRSVR